MTDCRGDVGPPLAGGRVSGRPKGKITASGKQRPYMGRMDCLGDVGPPLAGGRGWSQVHVKLAASGQPRPRAEAFYLYFGRYLPCALIRSSHMALILSIGNSAAVCGSIMAAW